MISSFDPKNGVIQREALIGLLIAQAACIFPLLFLLPPWIAVVWFFALTYRVQIFRSVWPYPSVILKVFIGGLCIAGVLLSYPSISGVEPMVSFLVCSFVLKLVEVRLRKDAYVILFICFIAIGAQFLFSQHILSSLYGMFALAIIIAAWQAIFFARDVSLSQHLKSSFSLLGQSMPFMLLLFIVMPRLGPLWAVPMPNPQASTGFGDTMSPGDISNLVKSGETAFRVSFEKDVPPAHELYWRGLVLDYFDGRTWRAGQLGRFDSRRRREVEVASVDDTARYSVILEPHNQTALFTLGIPLRFESPSVEAELSPTNVLVTAEPIVSKVQYSVVSALNVKSTRAALSQAELALSLQLPADSNPQAIALAASWREQYRDARDIISAALSLYAKRFRYTLQPPKLGEQSVDDFLFQTQAGFCEHFSSSFVFLMRAAGVPARVVVGYQGGTDFGTQEYVTVKQSDAHAWAEVWLPGVGWHTVDPTASVAPNRIDLGVEQALTADERVLISQGLWENTWLSSVYRSWDSVGYNWNRWVLNYDTKMQAGLLRFLLGAYEPLRVALAFTIISALLFAVYFLAVILLRRRRQPSSLESRLLIRVCKKLQAMGYPKPAHVTFASWSQCIAEKDPKLAAALLDIHKSYEQLCFAEQKSESSRFIALCKAFPKSPKMHSA